MQRAGRCGRLSPGNVFRLYPESVYDNPNIMPPYDLPELLRVSLASLGRLYAQPIATLMTAAVIAIALALPVGLYIGLANIAQVSSGWDGSTPSCARW